jgi:hypothetical protein
VEANSTGDQGSRRAVAPSDEQLTKGVSPVRRVPNNSTRIDFFFINSNNRTIYPKEVNKYMGGK